MAPLKKDRRAFPLGHCFILLLVSNSCLSYLPFPPMVKGWIFCLGFLIPLGVLMLRPDPREWKKSMEALEGGIRPVSLAMGGFLILLAVFLRFWRLFQPQLWLTGDEGLHGFLAIGLAQKWDWRFFYTVGEHPPLLIWALAFFFKHFRSSFFNLWFLPAMFSCLAIPAGYAVSRLSYPRALSALFGFLLAFSFWPLEAGRFCHQGLFIPFWEMADFLILGLWLKSRTPASGRSLAVLLGIWTGLGTLTFTSWWVLLFLTVATVFHLFRLKLLRQGGWFFAALLAALIPFLSAVIREGYGHHLLDSSGGGFTVIHRFLTHLSYLTCLFWGPLLPDASYGPSWGGMLNPVLTSCFGIGLLELYHQRAKGLSRWILASLALCLAPAFLAGDYVELNRILQVMPFLVLISLLGLGRLVALIPQPAQRKTALFGLLALSTLLDLNHYFQPLCGAMAQEKALDENWKAYRILQSAYHEKGPGILLTELLPLKFGHSLDVATYGFNAAENPALKPEESTWAALSTNVDYEPFLSRLLPGSRWYWLGPGTPDVEGGLAVGLIPLAPDNRLLVEHWSRAQALFHALGLEAEGVYNGQRNYQQAIVHAAEAYPLMKGDRFLESCYWEWVSQYYFTPSYAENMDAIAKAVQRGFPAAHLYEKLAELAAQQGKPVESEKALQKAREALPTFKWDSDLRIESP